MELGSNPFAIYQWHKSMWVKGSDLTLLGFEVSKKMSYKYPLTNPGFSQSEVHSYFSY